MFFQDHERAVYAPAVPGHDPEKKFDPLVIDNLLVLHSGGRIDTMLSDAGPDDGLGDVSDEGKLQRKLGRAKAELELAQVARNAFALPPFPDCTDGTALEYLYDYLEYMRGKGTRGGSTPG